MHEARRYGCHYGTDGILIFADNIDQILSHITVTLTAYNLNANYVQIRNWIILISDSIVTYFLIYRYFILCVVS